MGNHPANFWRTAFQKILLKGIIQMRYIARLSGITINTLLCDTSGSILSSHKGSIQAELAGLKGDRHFGHTFASNARYPYPRGTEIRNSRQVSIISVEEMKAVSAELGIPQIFPEWLGANLLVAGIPALTQVPPSSRLHFKNGAVLVVHGENDPCSHPGKVLQQEYPHIPRLSPAFIKAANHKRGLVAWVEKAGIIASDEPFEVEVAEQIDYTQFLP
jgi:hypothetical protein